VECCENLETLLRGSDVLSVHVPLEPSTRGLLGRRELSLLPEGAVVVNTSRGGVLDEAALVEALAAGRLAGAALDVVDGELEATARQRSLVLAYAREHPNVLVTPHLGGATVESRARTEVFMAEKLRRWCEARGLVRSVAVRG
jgi:phosphoglycerate dehydrogenase-like enzyme